MSNDAAGFTRVTDRSFASPNGAFDAGLRPDPFPDRAASLLPGLLAATRTGLPPAGDDELMSDHDHIIDLRLWAHSDFLCRRLWAGVIVADGRGWWAVVVAGRLWSVSR